MNSRAAALAVAVALWAAGSAHAQLVTQHTTDPTVTAENESWYLKGEPVMHAGNLYYPAGAQVYFNPTEMVRSGFFQGIPLYVRPTFEPYSIVYVPLAGGRMQPYQRPRTGELTGTAGSVPSPLPPPPATVPPPGLASQAAGPPSQTTIYIPVQIPGAGVAAAPELTTAAPERPTAGTSGRSPLPGHVSIGDPPQGTNAMFIEYAGSRWFPLGPPQRLDRAGLVRLSDYHGFEVWAGSPDASAIFIPATVGSDLAVAYSRTRPVK